MFEFRKAQTNVLEEIPLTVCRSGLRSIDRDHEFRAWRLRDTPPNSPAKSEAAEDRVMHRNGWILLEQFTEKAHGA